MSQTKYKIIKKKAAIDWGEDDSKEINKNDAVKFHLNFFKNPDNKDLAEAIKNKFKSIKEKFIVKEVKGDTVTIAGRGAVRDVEEMDVPIKALHWSAKKAGRQEDIMSEDDIEKVSKDTDFSSMSPDDVAKAKKTINTKLKQKMPLSYPELKMIVQRVISKDAAQAFSDVQAYVRKGADGDKLLNVFQETKFDISKDLGIITGYLAYKMSVQKSLTDKDLDYIIHSAKMNRGLVEYAFDNNEGKVIAKIESILKENPNANINQYAKDKHKDYLNNKQAMKDQEGGTQQAIQDQQLADEESDKAQVAGAEKYQQEQEDKEAADIASEDEKIKNDMRILKKRNIPEQIISRDFLEKLNNRDEKSYEILKKHHADIKSLSDAVEGQNAGYEFSDNFTTILNTDPTRPVEGDEVETLVEKGVENADDILRNPKILFTDPQNDTEVNAQADAKEAFIETYKELKRNKHEFSEDFMKVFDGILAQEKIAPEDAATNEEATTNEGNTILKEVKKKGITEQQMEMLYNNPFQLVNDLVSQNKASEFLNILTEAVHELGADDGVEDSSLGSDFKEFVTKLNDAIQKQNTQG